MTITPLAVVAGVLIGAWAATVVASRARRSADALPGKARRRVLDPVDVGAALVTGALLMMVGIGHTAPVRVVLALAFVTFVPGWALLGLLPTLNVVTVRDQATILGRVPLVQGLPKFALAVAISLTLATGAAQALLWLHLWHPSTLLGVLGSMSLLALEVRIVRPRAPSVSPAGPE